MPNKLIYTFDVPITAEAWEAIEPLVDEWGASTEVQEDTIMVYVPFERSQRQALRDAFFPVLLTIPGAAPKPMDADVQEEPT